MSKTIFVSDDELLQTYNSDNGDNKDSVDSKVLNWFYESIKVYEYDQLEKVSGGHNLIFN